MINNIYHASHLHSEITVEPDQVKLKQSLHNPVRSTQNVEGGEYQLSDYVEQLELLVLQLVSEEIVCDVMICLLGLITIHYDNICIIFQSNKLMHF